MEIKEIFDRYLQYKEYMGHTAASIKTEAERIARFLDYPVSEWVTEYYKHSSNRKPVSSLGTLVVVKKFFDWAIAQGFWEGNPFATIPKPKVAKILPKCLTKYEAQILLDAAGRVSARTKVVYHTFLLTGMRRGELLSLATEHVHFPENRIFIKLGKGNKDRVIPLHNRLKHVLLEWLSVKPPSNLMFDVSVSTLKRDQQKIIDICGVKHSFHMLRHTYASIAANTPGVNLRSLQKILGHAKLEMTEIYTHVSADEMLEQMNMVDI